MLAAADDLNAVPGGVPQYGTPVCSDGFAVCMRRTTSQAPGRGAYQPAGK